MPRSAPTAHTPRQISACSGPDRRGGEAASLLDVHVSTPTLELCGATHEMLDQLADVVRAGKTHADPAPYDDPMSFYETDPDLRVCGSPSGSGRSGGAAAPSSLMPGGSTSSSWLTAVPSGSRH
jgi:hypothetical protein